MNTTWTPTPGALPWDPQRGSLVCPGCPDHELHPDRERYELVLDGTGLDGGDHRDALRLIRRAPDFSSGPFTVPALPTGMAAIAVIDYLERQTFDGKDAATIKTELLARFPEAVVHAWTVGDNGDHVAEDASWFADEGLLIRSPVEDIAPHEFPMDVGWAPAAEMVETTDGPVELWRGCLYVEPMRPELVRYGWVDLPGPPAA